MMAFICSGCAVSFNSIHSTAKYCSRRCSNNDHKFLPRKKRVKNSKCSKCGLHDRLSYGQYCRLCHCARQKQYYREHPQSAARSHKTRQKFRRDYVKSKKDNLPCMDCGRPYSWYVMDFDHVRGKKQFNLSIVGSMICSIEKIDREIAKCDLVCANCHRKRTFERREGNQLLGHLI